MGFSQATPRKCQTNSRMNSSGVSITLSTLAGNYSTCAIACLKLYSHDTLQNQDFRHSYSVHLLENLFFSDYIFTFNYVSSRPGTSFLVLSIKGHFSRRGNKLKRKIIPQMIVTKSKTQLEARTSTSPKESRVYARML